MFKTKNQIIGIFLGSVIFLASSCSPVRVIHTDQLPDFSLQNYNTFDYYQVEASEDYPDFDTRVGWIQEELKTQLEARGVKHSGDDPDLLINIGIAVVEKTQTRDTDIRTDAHGYFSNQNYTWQSETVEAGKYLEGTVIVHFVDPDEKILLCEGVGQSIILDSEKASKKNIKTGIKKLLSDID
jgi:hypothetical protein